MSPKIPIQITCAKCLVLHEPKNPLLLNSICHSCSSPRERSHGGAT